MKTITQKELGKRIFELRKSKGYSQVELAKLLKISRPSVTQIELGNRSLSALELKKITDNLSVSIDKFKNILLHILEKCAGKPNIGETHLYRLLYFSDFNYYEIYEEHLTGIEYRKFPLGPIPQKVNVIINQMIAHKMVKKIKVEYHGHLHTRYIPLIKPNIKNLKASEKNILDKVIEQYSDWSSTAISDYANKDMPLLASKDGEIVDYELVFYREYPYSVRAYDDNINANDNKRARRVQEGSKKAFKEV